MSDTPETDANCWKDGMNEWVASNLARKLERERNSLQDQRDFCMGEIERLKQERDEAREALRVLFNDYKQLADSGDAGFWDLEDKDAAQPALRILRNMEAAK